MKQKRDKKEKTYEKKKNIKYITIDVFDDNYE